MDPNKAAYIQVKGRLATVERIVTGERHRLTHEIESLRGPTN